jgi:intracellular sulfur oxidation DsrE/DsrF family protein
MNRPTITRRALLSGAAATRAAAAARAQQAGRPGPPHEVVFQVSDADPAKSALALSNVRNVQTDLGRDKAAVEIVARESTMRNRQVSRDDMLPRIGCVEAGVVHPMKRRREGCAYIRP